MPGWMSYKLESRNKSLRYVDDTTLTAESEEELKSLLMRVKQESERSGLKLHIKKKKKKLRLWHLATLVLSHFSHI